MSPKFEEKLQFLKETMLESLGWSNYLVRNPPTFSLATIVTYENWTSLEFEGSKMVRTVHLIAGPAFK